MKKFLNMDKTSLLGGLIAIVLLVLYVGYQIFYYGFGSRPYPEVNLNKNESVNEAIQDVFKK